MSDVTEVRRLYASKGFGKRTGFGEKPAVLVIDFQRTFTDASSPWGADLQPQLRETARVLAAARKAQVPIFFTNVSYEPDSQDGARLWQMRQPEGLAQFFAPGTEWVEIDGALKRQRGEVVITKKYPSAFFGTDLCSRLNAQRIDTVIITGCTTSGCVRATVVDGISYEFRVIVAEETVGDRSALSHEVSLADIDAKYADVVSVEEVLEYLRSRV